LMKLSLLQ